MVVGGRNIFYEADSISEPLKIKASLRKESEFKLDFRFAPVHNGVNEYAIISACSNTLLILFNAGVS